MQISDDLKCGKELFTGIHVRWKKYYKYLLGVVRCKNELILTKEEKI